MANMLCAGANWVMLEDMGQRSNVYSFKKGYKAEKDVPIATCTTLIQGEDGTNFIAIGHEMLYFGQGMSHLLLNQNLIQAHIQHRWGHV